MHANTHEADSGRSMKIGLFLLISSAFACGSKAGTSPVDASSEGRILSDGGGGADVSNTMRDSGGGSGGDASQPADAAPGTDAALCHGDTTPIPCMPNSAFYQPIPSTPSLAPNSAAIMAYYAANWEWNYEEAPPVWNKGVQMWPDPELIYDGNMTAVYFAKTTDPLLTIKCFEPFCTGGGQPIDGIQIRVPEGARWQGYPDCADAGANQLTRGSCGDDHFQVISPDLTTEYDLYEAFGCFKNGSTCIIGSGGIAPYATSTGFSTQGGSNASAWIPTQGLVLPSEILAGVIPHGLALILNCSDGTSVAPATANAPGDACPDTTNALAEGQRIFITATDTQIESWGADGVTVPGQIVLKALAHYGGYYVDNLGYGGFDMETINQNSYSSPGTLTDDWPAVAAKYSLPKTGWANSYDLGLYKIPGGITSWLAVCAKGGC
jgi:hypothetical protein